MRNFVNNIPSVFSPNDSPAADNAVSIIANRRLSGSNGTLRAVKFKRHLVLVGLKQRRPFLALGIPDLRRHPYGTVNARTRYHIHISDNHPPAEKIGVVAERDGICRHILAADIHRLVEAHPEAFALSYRIANGPAMPSDHMSVQIEKISVREVHPAVPFEESDIITVRHKANILTVVLAGSNESVILRQLTHFCLGKSSHRKEYVGKLLLTQHIKKIGLILGMIDSLDQQPTS